MRDKQKTYTIEDLIEVVAWVKNKIEKERELVIAKRKLEAAQNNEERDEIIIAEIKKGLK